MDLSNGEAKPIGSDWAYANPAGNNQMLVQEKNGHVFLYDEKMGRTLIGSLPPMIAACFQDSYLAAVQERSVVLLKREKEGLREVRRYSPDLDADENLIQVLFSEDGFLTYSTDRGKFFYVFPSSFQGLPLPKIPRLPGDEEHPNRFPFTHPWFACFEKQREMP
jgi:hypothetical protein